MFKKTILNVYNGLDSFAVSGKNSEIDDFTSANELKFK